MWGKVVRYAEVTSTNDLARDHARRGESEGTAIMARYQSAGRGRRGRVWESACDSSLLASYILRPPAYLAHSAWLTLAGGVAAAKAVAALCERPAHLKWPNDVLLDGKKVGGILAESSLVGEGAVVVLGIGLNLNQTAEDFSPELQPSATSVALATGHEVTPEALLKVLGGELQTIYAALVHGGHDRVHDAWRVLDETLGRVVHVDSPAGSFEGHATHLDDQGALWLELPDGESRRVVAGDVSIRLGD